ATQPAALQSRPGCKVLLARDRAIERGDVDLAHAHHRSEGTARGFATSGHELHQALRRDLPGQAEAVLAPAAGTLLATAVLDDRLPIAVGLFLVFRRDLEADRFVELELGATVHQQIWHSEDRH